MAHWSSYAISYLCKDVPEALKQAVCEQAMWLLSAENTPSPEPANTPMMWSDVRVADREDEDGIYSSRLSRRGWSPSAARLLKPYVEMGRVG
jgi:hypothetical protein